MRTRTSETGLVVGTWQYDGTSRTREVYTEKSVCTDVSDNFGGENPLNISKWTPCVGIVNGTAGGGSFDNWPLDSYEVLTHLVYRDELAIYYRDAVGRTNPEAPEVLLPAFLAEIRHLPRDLRGAIRESRKLLKRVADANLTWEFSVKPIIADLRKLLDVSLSVQKRVRTLKHLAENGGDSRHALLKVYSEEGSWSSVKTLHSTLSLWITAKYKDRTEGRMWCSVPWEPTTTLLDALVTKSDEEFAHEALLASLALDKKGFEASAYELIPWSWLADWYGRFQTYIIEGGNRYASVAGDSCIMRTLVTEREYQVVSKPPDIEITELSSSFTTKEREIVIPDTTTAEIPFLTRRQIGILASLITQRLP